MADYSIEMISDRTDLQELAGIEIGLLEHLVFGGVSPNLLPLHAYARIDILERILQDGLDEMMAKPILMIEFQSNCAEFLRTDMILSAKKLAFKHFSTSFNLDLEGRCLLISHDRKVSVLSDFNDFQVILADSSMSDMMERAGLSDELSDLEVNELGQKEAAFIDALLRRVRSWNNAQAAFDG